jgi:CBS domain-containing protein
MIDVPVSAVMTETIPTVPPDATTVEVSRRLRPADVHAVVVDDGNDLVGIVTEADIVAVVAEGGENPTVESFMSSPVVTVESTVPVGIAADRMRDAGVVRLPVVEDGRYLGLVTRADVAPYLSRHRLDVDWEGDPLSLEGTGTPEQSAE